MADFIAVIRRAVDGLSENTPEMRAKVYERAKSAVVRQLENMKPRPPEVMFQRQLDKLDSAIREVEAEHAEAMAADAEPEEAALAEEPVAAAVEEPAPEVVEEPAAAPEPEYYEPEPLPEAVPLPAPAFAAAQPDPVVHQAETFEPEPEPAIEQSEPKVAQLVAEPEQPAPTVEPEPVVPDYVTTEQPFEAPVAHLEPEAHPVQIGVKPYDAVPEIQQPEAKAFAQEPVADHVAPAETAFESYAAPVVEAAPVFEAPVVETRSSPVQDSILSELTAKPAEQSRQWQAEVDREPEVAKVADVPVVEETPPMPKVSYDETDVVAGFNDFLKEELNRQVVPPPPAKAKKQDDFSWDAPFDDLPEVRKPETFEKALEAKQKEIAAGAEKRASQPPKVEPVSARAELEDLIGLEPAQRRQAPVATDTGALPPDVNRAMSKLEGKSFKMQKKPAKSKGGIRILPIALGIVGALVVGGGAYALWHYKDDVSALVTKMMPATDTKKPVDSAKRDIQSDTKSPTVKTTTDTADNKAKQPVKETEVASLNTDIGPQKFTQRLLADGTETATDTAKVPIDQALPEGKTVAKQTDKGKEVADTTTAATTTDAKTDATSTNTPAVANDAQPIGATQKMYLYEERLGQSSPVAVPGTVVWREKPETEDGKPDPTIEAQLDVPDRKITAMLTFKRNTDASLPASHIIEIVFALPKNFEEGNVDSIQRVAFKQTEQDRGNPLIAVPAKITDDFHMVALNDDADARKVNLELMKTRQWIDIPITYRNGRRALITIEKGATGTAVFDKVMAEWDALGQQTNAQQ